MMHCCQEQAYPAAVTIAPAGHETPCSEETTDQQEQR
jgi:hypothetical protein